jgi:hypothetical protein
MVAHRCHSAASSAGCAIGPPFDRAPTLRTSPIGSGPMDVLVPPYVPYPLTLVSSTCAMSLSAK